MFAVRSLDAIFSPTTVKEESIINKRYFTKDERTKGNM